MILSGALGAFLLAFPSLFSIVNPFAGALIFSEITAERPSDQRRYLAGRIGLYGAVVMLVSLWAGSYVLAFFGITLSALRIAGGLVVAIRAWALLSAPDAVDERKQEQAAQSAAAPCDQIAFFPLTMPFTTGPGTIAVAITIGSARPPVGPELVPFFLGCSAAAVAMAVLIWLCYLSADRLVALLGKNAAHVISRLSAFILLCIGVQIASNGVADLIGPILAGRG